MTKMQVMEALVNYFWWKEDVPYAVSRAAESYGICIETLFDLLRGVDDTIGGDDETEE